MSEPNESCRWRSVKQNLVRISDGACKNPILRDDGNSDKLWAHSFSKKSWSVNSPKINEKISLATTQNPLMLKWVRRGHEFPISFRADLWDSRIWWRFKLVRCLRELREVIRGFIFSTEVGFFMDLKSIFNFWSSLEFSEIVEISFRFGSPSGKAAWVSSSWNDSSSTQSRNTQGSILFSFRSKQIL